MRGLVALVALAGASCANGQPTVSDPRAEAVIERSKRTTAAYSLYTWNRMPTGQEPGDGWSAEFHRGTLHRVETPIVRIIADCANMTATMLSLPDGKKSADPSLAKAACGIATVEPIDASKWLGRHQTEFGEADRIQVTISNSVRTYDVLDNGALVAATYADEDGVVHLQNRALALLGTAPEEIFSEASLDRSAVPERFKAPPAAASE